MTSEKVSGVGLGFRLGLAEAMLSQSTTEADFIEIAPENYLHCGGRRGRYLRAARERWPIVSHGLCGDFAGSAPLDEALIEELRVFLKDNSAQFYSDHLCLTHAANAELHDLLPLPFSAEAVERAAVRVRELQKRLEVPVGVENISAYARAPGGTMSETDFVRAVVEESGGYLLLDVNNVYVNSRNFGFDPKEYIDALPLDRVIQIHIAGHEEEEADLLVDTHGAPIVNDVFDLYEYTCHALRSQNLDPPTLLERDNNLPPLAELEDELRAVKAIRQASFLEAS